jgi:putative ABC transport system permease protein
LTALLPADVPRAGSIRLDMPVLLTASLIVVGATIAFGSVAAIRGRRSAGSGEPPGIDVRGARAQAPARGGTLVAAEVALGLALSLMALLMMRSFIALRAVDLGFSAESVTVARLALPGDRYPTPATQRAFFAALLDRIRARPGVDAAGIVSARPFGGLGPATIVRDAATPAAAAALPPVTDIRFADTGFFRTLRLATMRGQLFSGENLAGPVQTIVNESLAAALWPGQDPIGRELAIEINEGTIATVVGVVADHHLMDVQTPVRPAAYLPEPRYPDVQRDVVVRAAMPADAVVSSMRTAAAALEPSLPLYQVTTMSQLVDTSLASDRFTTALLGGFAIVALLLAAVGIFGVFSADVAERRREIGVRIALGAGSWRVVSLVLRRALARAAAGVAAGAILALLLARFMTSLLYGIGPADPGSLAIVAALLLAIATGATLIPAFKALRSSPLDVLRSE